MIAIVNSPLLKGPRILQEVKVLNNAYLPLGKTNVERAIVLLILDKAFSIKDTKRVIRSQHIALPIPEIIVLKDVTHIHKSKPIWSKAAVFKRDNYKCVICECNIRGYLTLEHLIPRKRWKEISKERELTYGVNSFLNCVTLCKWCNNYKGDKLPEDIGWGHLKGYEPISDFYIDWEMLMNINE